MSKLTAAQQRFFDNAVLIAAMGLIFTRLEKIGIPVQYLKDIAQTTSGGTPQRNVSEYYGGDIPWIKSGELNDGIIETSEEYITEEGLRNSSAKIYPKGTLVIALYGATVGKTGILAIDAASNQAVCAITAETSIISTNYLFWFLRYKRPDFLKNSFGGAQPNISQSVLRETYLPLPDKELQAAICQFLEVVEQRLKGDRALELPSLPPPLSEIRNTVVRIEELAGKIEEARKLREQLLEETSTLLEAEIDGTFKKLQDTPKVPLLKITSKIGSGSTPSGGRSTYSSSGIPFIRSMNVRMRQFTWEGMAFIDEATHESMKGTQVKPNDVLLNITGASIGRVACAPADLTEANVNQHVAIIRPLDNLNPYYLMYWLSQPRIQEYINDAQKGATRQGFTKRQIELLEVPLVSLSEQEEIVSFLDSERAQLEILKQIQNETRKELDALLPSILDKAFKGEL